MNLKELTAKFKQYQSAAQLKYDEATKAISEENFEQAEALRTEGDGLATKAAAVKSQIDSLNKVNGMQVDEPVEKEEQPEKVEKTAEPNRLPFSVQDDPELADNGQSEKDMSVKEATYVMKYSDMDDAVKAVAFDLYGKDYLDKREKQMKYFSHYLRSGKISIEGERALKTLIMRPESIRQDIEEGVDYQVMKASTLQESINELGGYLVPEDYRVELIKRLAGQTIIRQRARKVSTNRDAAEWPKLEGGDDRYTSAVRVTWVDELPADENVSKTNPTFGMLRVPVHTVMARVDISRNQLEDTAFNLLDIVAELFSEAAAVDEDVQFATGIGGGRPHGILGNRSGEEATPVNGIEVINSGAAGALTADGLFDLAYSLPIQYRQRGAWISARTSHRDIRKLKDGNSRYLWEDSLKAGEPPQLLGYPVLENESMPTVAANSHPLVFGDLMGYLVVDRIGMTLERVVDTGTVGGNYVALFMRRRLGGQVIEPWRLKAQKVAS